MSTLSMLVINAQFWYMWNSALGKTVYLKDLAHSFLNTNIPAGNKHVYTFFSSLLIILHLQATASLYLWCHQSSLRGVMMMLQMDGMMTGMMKPQAAIVVVIMNHTCHPFQEEKLILQLWEQALFGRVWIGTSLPANVCHLIQSSQDGLRKILFWLMPNNFTHGYPGQPQTVFREINFHW